MEWIRVKTAQPRTNIPEGTQPKHTNLKKPHDGVDHLPMPLIVKPAQLRYPAQQLDQARPHVVRQRRTHAAQIVQDVVPDLDPLGGGEVVPVVRNEPG